MSAGGAAVRAGAARVLAGVLAGRSMDAVLAEAESSCRKEADRSLLRAISYGAVREHRFLAGLRDALLDRPLKARDVKLGALLEVGLYQLRAMRMPAYAAVGETVAATAPLGLTRARGLVNAVLRRYQREGDAVETELPGTPGVRYSYPDWLVAALESQWHERWEALLEAGNTPGPMTLRVNLRQNTRQDYLTALEGAGLRARPGRYAESAVILDAPAPVHDLPGFDNGAVTVQDEAAQLVAPLLAPAEGERILDACAAPGGKATHLLECAPDAELWTLDVDPKRLQRVAQNLKRLGMKAHTRATDAADTTVWWDGRPFQRILLDAPCSGTGVIRRHPDIKWLRRAGDIPQLAHGQRRLLDALWRCLAPGGCLVYATCSLLEEENAAVISGFLNAHADAREMLIEASWGEACRYGRRIAMGDDGMDGFYYARIEKARSL